MHALKWLSSLCVLDAAFAADFGALLLAPLAKQPAAARAAAAAEAGEQEGWGEQEAARAGGGGTGWAGQTVAGRGTSEQRTTTRWAHYFDQADSNMHLSLGGYKDDFLAVKQRSHAPPHPFPRLFGFTLNHIGASARAVRLMASVAASTAAADGSAAVGHAAEQAVGRAAAAAAVGTGTADGAGGAEPQSTDLQPVDNLLTQLLRIDALLPKAISQELHKLYLSTLGDVSNSSSHHLISSSSRHLTSSTSRPSAT